MVAREPGTGSPVAKLAAFVTPADSSNGGVTSTFKSTRNAAPEVWPACAPAKVRTPLPPMKAFPFPSLATTFATAPSRRP